MKDDKYSLNLSGNGVRIEQHIDKQTALAIVNLVMGGTQFDPPDPGDRSPPPKDPAPKEAGSQDNMSVGEFVADVNAKRNPDKIVAIGAYLLAQGQKQFTSDDIKPLFQAAGEPAPGNFPRDWRWAQSTKWIAPVAGNPKAFFVTNTGNKAVSARFPVEMRKATPQPTRRKTRKRTGANATEAE